MATAEQDQGKDRKKQHRSPAYPSMGLGKALEYATAIYKQEKRSAAPVSVVAEHCKTDIKSSKGLRLIAALKQFDLVVELGSGDSRKVRLSDRAIDIELADSPEKKQEAIRGAALAPSLHRKIWEHYGGELPSDATLKLYLLKELDFNDTYVDRFIKQFRATLTFAGITGGDIIDDVDEGDDDSQPIKQESREKPVSAVLPAKSENAVVRDFPIPLMSGGLAVIKVPVPMSESDFEQITGTLKAWKAALVRPTDEYGDPV